MTEPTLPVSLTVTRPGGAVQVLEFTVGEALMIGSGASCHVRIESDGVSSLHCMIKSRDARLVVLDLGSDEGTLLNGAEIHGERPLADGDTLTVGDVRVAVHSGGDVLAPTVPLRTAHAAERGADADATLVEGDAIQYAATRVTGAGADRPGRAAVAEADTLPSAAPQRDAALPKVGRPRPEARPRKTRQPSTDGAQSKATSVPEGTPSRTSPDSPRSAEHKPMGISPEKSKSTSGMPVSKRHDEARGHHVQAKNLSTRLGEHEQPKTVGHVEVTMLWGGSVMGVHRLSGAGAVTIGDGDKSTFRVSHAAIPNPSFPLVTLTPQGAVIRVVDGMDARVDKANQPAGTVTLALGQSARVRVGAVEFVIQYAQRYAPIELGFFHALDFLYAKVFSVAMIFQLALMFAMIITPKIEGDGDDDLFQNPNEFQALILKPEEKKKEKKEDLSGKKAARHKDDEGVFGKKDKPKEDKLASKAGAPKVDKDKREEDRKLAMDALAALGLKGPDGAVSNVLGPGGLGSGINNALGGLQGASMGDAGGAGGLGSRGTGAGGGGNALGIGGLGSGTGRGSGGAGGIDLGGRGKGMTRVQPGNVIHKGSLSKEEIQRVIKRVMNQIKFCYEKELNKDPNLEGKLVASWVIAGSGDVASSNAAQNTLGNKAVEDCVMRIIQRLKFPQPQGGGQVFVTFPFVFSPSG